MVEFDNALQGSPIRDTPAAVETRATVERSPFDLAGRAFLGVWSSIELTMLTLESILSLTYMSEGAEDDWKWHDRETPKLDEGITPELYLDCRSPRFGLTNPQPICNPVWEWLVRSRVSSDWINEKLRGPSPFDQGPGWCFDRFGRTTLIWQTDGK